MKDVLIFCTVIMSSLLVSQTSFHSDSISPLLKTGMNAVIRMDETVFIRKNIRKGKYYRHFAVTILNERGQDAYAVYWANYNKLVRLKKLNGKLYDKNGKRIERLGKKDVQDFTVDSPDQVSEERYKIAKFSHKYPGYPYTIEFLSVSESRNLMFYPELHISCHPNTGIEKKTLTIRSPDKFAFRYREQNVPPARILKNKDKSTTYTWTLENLLIYEKEPLPDESTFPRILSSPVELEVEGYRGDLKTWADIGKFYYNLNKGRDALPEKVMAEISKLVGDEADTLKKIEKLYSYLQNNTRYVSVQLGIGGWQTTSAKDVAKTGQGDCKALSNYMGALLKHCGIRSYSALVSAGLHELKNTDDFPRPTFNHVIRCVPLNNDTIWLECTSQTMPTGYLGSYTGNRKALIIYQDSGVLVNTIAYSAENNRVNTKARITVDASGDAKAVVTATNTALQQEDLNRVFHYIDREEQKRVLSEEFGFPSFELLNFSLKENKGRIPSMEKKLEINIKNILSQTGSHCTFRPGIYCFAPNTPADDTVRKTSFYLDPAIYNFYSQDTAIYELPENYSIEYLPSPATLNSKFGTYSVNFVYENGNLVYSREMKMNGGTYPSVVYDDFIDFIKKVNRNDKLTVALKKIK